MNIKKKKKYLLILICIIVLFASCSMPAADKLQEGNSLFDTEIPKSRGSGNSADLNIIRNPGFEIECAQSGKKAFPWVDRYGNDLRKSSQLKHTGTYSAAITNWAVYPLGFSTKSAGKYWIEAWVYIPSDSSNTNERIKIKVGYHRRWQSLSFNMNGNKDKWHKISGVIKTRHFFDGDKIELRIIAPRTSNIMYVDDVFMAPIEPLSKHAFPQNLSYSKCIKPDKKQRDLNFDVLLFYTKWRKEYIKKYIIKNGAVDRHAKVCIVAAEANGDIHEGWGNTEAASQSEATGYGMLISVQMAGTEYSREAKKDFDKLYRLYRNYPSLHHPDLMSWAVPVGGDGTLPALPSASDGDMDVAYALLLANGQWGGSPEGFNITYYDAAIKILNAISATNIYTDNGVHFPRLGIGNKEAGQNYHKYRATRPCDFMLDHLFRFSLATGDSIWTSLKNTTDEIIDYFYSFNGLIFLPDFAGNSGGHQFPITTFAGISDEAFGIMDTEYYYNSCRTPWRFALSYASGQTNDQGMNLALNTINNWLFTNPDFNKNGKFYPSAVQSAYSLRGKELDVKAIYLAKADQLEQAGQIKEAKKLRKKVKKDSLIANWDDTAFQSPFMAGMIVSDNQDALTSTWELVKNFNDGKWGNYYSNTLTLLSMLLVSGNWRAPVSLFESEPEPQVVDIKSRIDKT